MRLAEQLITGEIRLFVSSSTYHSRRISHLIQTGRSTNIRWFEYSFFFRGQRISSHVLWGVQNGQHSLVRRRIVFDSDTQDATRSVASWWRADGASRCGREHEGAHLVRALAARPIRRQEPSAGPLSIPRASSTPPRRYAPFLPHIV